MAEVGAEARRKGGGGGSGGEGAEARAEVVGLADLDVGGGLGLGGGGFGPCEGLYYASPGPCAVARASEYERTAARLEAAVASAGLASASDPAALRAIADLAATADVLVGPSRYSGASTRSHFTELELFLSPK